MKYENNTIIELKDICKRREIKGYSKLNKSELIRLIKKNLSKPCKTYKTYQTIHKKELKGGTNNELVQGNVSIIHSILTVMLFIGDDVKSAGTITLDKIYTVENIKSMSFDDLQDMLNKHDYYQNPIVEEYFTLNKRIKLKKDNNTGEKNLKQIGNNGNSFLKNKKNTKSYIDNSEFKDNEPVLVVALDNSIIYSSKPFKSNLLVKEFKESYNKEYRNNRNNKLKIENNNNNKSQKVVTVEGTFVKNTNNTKNASKTKGILGWFGL